MRTGTAIKIFPVHLDKKTPCEARWNGGACL
jgi:hypothetical protein